jgi:hypothetical protein
MLGEIDELGTVIASSDYKSMAVFASEILVRRVWKTSRGIVSGE